MAFRGKDSKKNALDKGIDRSGRINYFSHNKKAQPITQSEAQPLRGAMAELASVVAAMDEEEVAANQRKEEELQHKLRDETQRNINKLIKEADKLSTTTAGAIATHTDSQPKLSLTRTHSKKASTMKPRIMKASA